MGQDIYMEWDGSGAELLHTPGGVQDTYGAMCANKLKIQSAVHEVLCSYGFKDIQTPAFEYFDIVKKEVLYHLMRCLSSLTGEIIPLF